MSQQTFKKEAIKLCFDANKTPGIYNERAVFLLLKYIILMSTIALK